MKKFWKALGIAALAAVVPVRVQKDEETGKKTFQSLLWKLDVTPDPDNSGTEIGLDLMEGVLTRPILNAVTAKREAALFADDGRDSGDTPPPTRPPKTTSTLSFNGGTHK